MGSIEKTAQYWPEEVNKSLAADHMEITLLEQTEVLEEELICRKLQIKNWKTNDEQVLNMYQYLQWPDVGIPKDSLTVFELIHTVKKMNSSSAIVHCCAGVDRTGSFIALARLIDEIHSKPEKLNVFDTVLNLRKDRKLMVMKEQQYKYLHTATSDYLDLISHMEDLDVEN